MPASPPDAPEPAPPTPLRGVGVGGARRAGSRIMMWLALVTIAATVTGAYVVGVRAAAVFLSGMVALFAIIRAVRPAPGPYGISTRSRTFDVAVLVIFAVVIGLLAVGSPNI